MGKPYRVVISPGIDFYLNNLDVVRLRELGCPWACDRVAVPCASVSVIDRKFTPSQDELPRHDKALIELAEGYDRSGPLKRFDVVELEVKVWPPKYFVLNTQPMGGEEVFEPCTVPWKTVYYSEKYNLLETLTFEEQLMAKINAIAP